MPIDPRRLIRDFDGIPQPSPELVQRLKRFDPRIGIRYSKVAWQITEDWTENDPRRAGIRSGETDPRFAFDICGYLPISCDVSQAPAFIERELSSWSPTQFQALREATRRWNEEGQDAAVMDTVLSAVSNDLDKSDIVTKGASEAVAVDLKPEKAKKVQAA